MWPGLGHHDAWRGTGGGGGGRFGRDFDGEFCSTRPTRTAPSLPLLRSGDQPDGAIGRSADRPHGCRSAVLKMPFGDVSRWWSKEAPFYHVTADRSPGLERHQWRKRSRRRSSKSRIRLTADAAADAGTDFPSAVRGRWPRWPGRRNIPDEVSSSSRRKSAPHRCFFGRADAGCDGARQGLDYNLILDGVHEAWLIPGELSAAKVQVVLTPRSRRRPQPGKEDSSGSSIETRSIWKRRCAVRRRSPRRGSRRRYIGQSRWPARRDLMSLPWRPRCGPRRCSEQTALEA